MMPQNSLHEIVLTGASASGKTTALAYLMQKLEDRGIKVLCCPEVATLMLGSGLGDVPLLRDSHPERFRALQQGMLGLQMQLREHMLHQARHIDGPVVVLYDRAEMDIQAYVGKEMFEDILSEHSLSEAGLRDHYHAVIHLVSVAVDYPEWYNNDNNPSRWDDVEHARQTDGLLLQAWTGTPHLWVVDNHERLEGKLERTLDIVLHTLGLPQPVEHEHKFLLSEAPALELLEQHGAKPIDIEQYYLQGPGGPFRLRARSQAGMSTFFHTVKEDLPDGGRAEYEARISQEEYHRLLEDTGGQRSTLSKRRWCFAWQGHYYELDQIDNIWLLEVETLPGDQKPLVPDWLGEAKDVTDDPAYLSSSLAKKSL